MSTHALLIFLWLHDSSAHAAEIYNKILASTLRYVRRSGRRHLRPQTSEPVGTLGRRHPDSYQELRTAPSPPFNQSQQFTKFSTPCIQIYSKIKGSLLQMPKGRKPNFIFNTSPRNWTKLSMNSPPDLLQQLTLTIYTWTECTDNSSRQTLVSGQVAGSHVLQKSCGDSPGFTSKVLRKFCAEQLTILNFPVKIGGFSLKNRKIAGKVFNFFRKILQFFLKISADLYGKMHGFYRKM